MNDEAREVLKQVKVDKVVEKLPKPEKETSKPVKPKKATKKEPANGEKAAIEPVKSEQLTGTVSVTFNRGFGFITAGKESIYLHTSKILNGNINNLKPGDKVTFQVIPANKENGCRQAVNVEKVEG